MQKKAFIQRIKKDIIYSKRGEIYDRNNKKLVTNLLVKSIYAEPHRIKNKESVATYLASKLDLEKKDILKKLNKKKYFVWIKRKVEDKVGEEIINQKIEGIGFVTEYKRFYPKDRLAAHILGFVGIDNQPLAGIELSYNHILRGQEGFIKAERDVRGFLIPTGYYIERKPIDGYNLILTIDEVIQHIVEDELKKTVEEQNAKLGMIMVNNPYTGEVLAFAGYPNFSSPNFNQFDKELWKNNAVSYVYEPGSIFKTILAAATIDTKAIDLNEKFYCGSSLQVGNRIIHCYRYKAHGDVNLKEIIKESCNVGAAQVSLKLGFDKFMKYIKKFGFGKLTNVDLPSEEVGLLEEDNLSNIRLTNLSFGQGIGITPIQLLTAISAIANDGLLIQPYVVKEIRDRKGNIIRRFTPKVVRRVLKKETCSILKDMLENAVNEGTGKLAALPGYTVCGKTSTAQKVEEGHYTNDSITSFLGFVPKDKPRICILIIIDTPQKEHSGGLVCAPVFANVAKQILCYMGIPPDKKIELVATAQNIEE